MSLILLLFIVLLFPSWGFAQQRSAPEDTIYQFNSQILHRLNQESPKNYARAAHEFSFIGEYKQALVYNDKTLSAFGKLSSQDSLYFKSLTPVAAKNYIASRASSEQIIMINEAHHVPLHRVFTLSLLEDLYRAGFRYLGAETINYMDKHLNQRGYPVLSTGFYSVEPQYGELIRKAIELGFTLFAYEAQSLETFMDRTEREISQAKNIAQILAQDPTAKIIIHAGYDHIREDTTAGLTMMAGRVKQFTGIDPFTINQDVLTERGTWGLENPYYKLVQVKQPTLFVDESNKPFAGPVGSTYYDARVFHPRTVYIHNRADWLLLNGERKHYFIRDKELAKVGFPCLVFAYKADEPVGQAIAVDIIELADKNDKPLIVSRGAYNIILKNEKGLAHTFSIKVN